MVQKSQLSFHLAFSDWRINVYTVFDASAIEEVMDWLKDDAVRSRQVRDFLNFGNCGFRGAIVDFESDMQIMDTDFLDILFQEVIDDS